MAESQNIEWKSAWHDEYLKWVCGFANAHGGKIYIGIDDKGNVVGVPNSKKLLEDIPNKIRNHIGIVADVNLHEKDGRDYLEIIVNPSDFPVNYDGEYHYRSGSTKQQLTGNALTQFLVKKTGFKWEDATVDQLRVDDLDQESFEIFRREAVRSGRMSRESLDIGNGEMLEHLGLLVDGKLTRAAVALFCRNADRRFTGMFVKIGRFGKGSDLRFQDDVHGSLIWLADRVIDLIYLKYLTAPISYDKDTRIETYPFPREGVREAVYNALIHTDWSDGIPVQIRIEDDAMYISNSCIFPENWTAETLLEKHRSIPTNPKIANTFYRAGYVESWGRGIQKICEECEKNGAKPPKFEILGNTFTITFSALDTAARLKHHTKHQGDGLDDVLDERIINRTSKW